MISSKKMNKRKICSTGNESIVNDVPILHAEKIHIDKNYKCNVCNMSFELQETLNDHKEEIHVQNESKYFCRLFLN